MKLTDFILICILVVLSILTLTIISGFKTIEEALQFPMIATTQTNYINTIHTNIMDGKYDVSENLKERKKK
uniref:Uncharacterized protein n=1 Tax=viral metagenome TaxID=1070528 RepID=A0A6H1ZWW1_9ZZZZ